MSRRGLLVSAALLLPGGLATLAQSQSGTFDYTVQTQAPALKQDDVTVGNIHWQCQGQTCKTSGPWPVPGVSACQSLAKVVGPIRSYGHPQRQLGKAELEKCNSVASANVSAAKPASVKPSTSVVNAPANVTRDSTSNLPRAQQQVQAQARSGKFAALVRKRQEEAAAAKQQQEALERKARYARSAHGLDCDDLHANVHPGAAEICDGYDNDCNGVIDEGQTLRRYLDADGDGHGDPSHVVDACPSEISGAAQQAEANGGGWLVEVGNDCDDQDPDHWRDCPR